MKPNIDSETAAYTLVDDAAIAQFQQMLGAEHVFEDAETRTLYGHDETEDLSFPPEVVLKPETPDEIAAVLRYCNERRIPVTPIGARTGLSGGALSLFGGVGLSLERLNRILHIDTQNLQATVEPGVITQVFQESVEEHGLMYAPDPASRGSCFIGGNIAENSGGPRALKYGVTKDFVLNLEVVLPNGEIIWTGANTLKNSTGYNLTQLMVGSEGTLGIVTKAVMKLLPKPGHNMLMLVPFNSAEKACEAVSAVFRAGITPSAMEFMERDAIDWSLKYVDDVSLPVGEEVAAHLLVEVDGNNPEQLMEECEKISALMEDYGATDVLFADDEQQKNTLWKLRRKVGEAVKAHSVYKEEDTVVPRFALPVLLNGVKEIGRKYGFHSVCYGHAGDGNLHVNIIRGELSEEQWNETLQKGIREIFELTASLGGTISGEHGIGYVQRPFLDVVFSSTHRNIFQQIKQAFDPRGILNPGKAI
ncbi:MAG: FAD-binding protein [Cryomorphaceae bacterium]|nr:MAG: FAD-binding protein [Cryomorphaceae bacterium]